MAFDHRRLLCDGVVRRGEDRCHVIEDCPTSSAQPLPHIGELCIPHLERELGIGVKPAVCTSQQCVALLEHPLHLATKCRITRVASRNGGIDPAATQRRPPLTNSRSSGENTVTWTRPRRSFARFTRWRLIWIRFRPTLGISISTSCSRPSSASIVERITAASAPSRTRASSGAPRKEPAPDIHARDSMRFVLPWPFSPTTAVKPSPNDTSTLRYERQSVSDRLRIFTRRSAHATGISRYKKLGSSDDLSNAGFNSSTVSRMISSPGATSIPSIRYSGLKATVRSSPLYDASTAS